MVSIPSFITAFIFTPLMLGGIGNIAKYFLEGLTALIERIINGATNLMIDVFNGLIWLIVGTPTPAQGEFNEQIFSIPQGGSWAPFYDFFIESVQPLAILLLILQISLVLLFTSGPFLFSNYDKEKYFRRIFKAFVGVIAWWFMFSASTAFANQLAMFLAGLNSGANVQDVGFGQFFEIVAQALLATTAIATIGALAMLASAVLVLFVIVMYVARMVVIYSYSFAMPLFMALWPANIGFLKPVSDLMKKFMGLYVPILFLTLPNALMIRATYLFAEAAVTPSDTSIDQDGVFGFVGTAIGDLLEGILFLAIALILPILAVIAPKYVFQATSGSFGKVARSIERSRAMSQMSRGMGGGGAGVGGGGEASGAGGGSPSPSGSGGMGSTSPSASDGMNSQPTPSEGRSGALGGGGGVGVGGRQEDEQRDYQFSIGRAQFSTKNARGRAQRLSQGIGAAQQQVAGVKSKFENNTPTSTFQSIESRKKAYEDENGNRVPVETTEPTTLEDMDDEYVEPQTAYDRYNDDQLQEFESVADTGDGFNSPEPYYTPEEPETAEGGMDVDPETDPAWINTDSEEYVGDTTFSVEQAQENSPVERSTVETAPPRTIEDMDDEEVKPEIPYDRYGSEQLREFDTIADTGDEFESPEPEYSPDDPTTLEDMDIDAESGGGATTEASTTSSEPQRGSDLGYGGEDESDTGSAFDDLPSAEESIEDPFAELGNESNESGGDSTESRSGSDIDDLLSEEFSGVESDGIDYEERRE